MTTAPVEWPPGLVIITAAEAAAIFADYPPPPELKPCPVAGCRRRIKIDMPLCEYHWAELPRDIREEIWALFNGKASRAWPYLERSQSPEFNTAVRDAAARLAEK